MFKIILITIILDSIFSIVYILGANTIACRDENNEVVDYYYLYKLPKSNRNIDGENYLFLTSNDANNIQTEWTDSHKKISELNSIPGFTLSSMYSNKSIESNLIILYNDEPPHGETDGFRGHTKGVVIANENGTGLWLIHSVPHYPPDLIDQKYNYPQTGTLYGQSFLCISFGNKNELELIGQQLIYNNIHVYSSNVPEALHNTYPTLLKASKMVDVKQPPYNNLVKLKSSENNEFLSFAKSKDFNKELYVDWVAPVFKTNLYVETWQHGGGNIGTDCNRINRVFNIDEINIKYLNYSFNSLKDHSKWAIGEEKDWICIGDINRQEHQKKRGGGTVCFESNVITQVYREIVEDVEPCHK